MTADIENKYYQVPVDDIHSQRVSSVQWVKVLHMHIKLVGIAAFCLTVILMAGFTAHSTMFQKTNMATPTNLMSVPFSGAGSTMINPTMRYNVLPGSSQFKNIALAAIESNDLSNQMRQVSMKAAIQAQGKLKDGVSDMDSREASTRILATKAQENLKDKLSNADAKTKATVKKLEEEVALKAKDMPGVTEPLGFFDPLGISAEVPQGRLLFFREVELKHGRLAMLATVGILVGEQFHPMFGGNIDVPAYIAFQQTPLQTFWPAVAIAIAIPEVFFGLFDVTANKETDGVYSAKFSSKFEADVSLWTLKLTDRLWTMKADHKPGDWGFDPLKLRPNDGWLERREERWKEMQTKELNNGRLAMIAAAGMIAQELATGKKIF